MDNPFASLDEALDHVLKEGREDGRVDIRIAGSVALRNPVTISRDMRIDGGWRRDGPFRIEGPDNGAALVLGDGFSWIVNSGAALTLSGLTAERRRGENPLIELQKNAKLEIVNSAITHSGPLLRMEGAACDIRNSHITTKISGEWRIPALSVMESVIRISNSRFQLEGNYGLLLEQRGGSLSAENSVFLSAGLRAASVFALNGARVNLRDLSLSADARDYASALEASGSELVLSGGTLGVSARDTCAVMLDQSSAVFLAAQIRVGNSSAARAMEIRGAFPLVDNCSFYSSNNAGRSEVFSGIEAAAPQTGSITDSSFFGFTHIWGGAWPLERLQAFNRAFASPDKPNTGK
jgi:hypothetical protein